MRGFIFDTTLFFVKRGNSYIQRACGMKWIYNSGVVLGEAIGVEDYKRLTGTIHVHLKMQKFQTCENIFCGSLLDFLSQN